MDLDHEFEGLKGLPRQVHFEVPCAAVSQRKRLPTESLYGFWSRYCYVTGWSVSEALEHYVPYRLNSNLLAQPPEQSMVLPFGGVISNDSYLALPSAVARFCLTDTLRFCKRCWAAGVHTDLFQHLAVDRCPVHSQELLDRCPQCETPLRPTLSACLTLPYGCAACGHLFLTRLNAHQIDDELKACMLMFADRVRDLCQIGNGFLYNSLSWPNSQRRWWDPPVPSPRGRVARGRQVRRHSVWSEPVQPRWAVGHPSEIEMRLTDWAEPLDAIDAAARRRLLEETGTATLHWLVQVCRHGWPSNIRLRTLLGMNPQFLFVDTRVAMVAAALHSVMCQYGESARPIECPEHGPYDNIVFATKRFTYYPQQSGEAQALLIHFEVLGAFAAALLSVAKEKVSRNLRWPVDISHMDYRPSWVVSVPSPSGVPLLRCRPRVTRSLVIRLIRRYHGLHLDGEHWQTLRGGQ
jgi:hypothetical protein